ncbi:hypothetical protein C0Q70_06979 [Pomacea canaliculata]|uniref:Carbonic anhydrase n=1 Tax=Pomacea canaliculata TaxID=400727 RepID=A0A2T7PDR6_POMCA|nr:hypothetical protein C0Q70_06979 [Pomacea canaliculata]
MNVTGGGLDGPYQVAQFHFHWGSNSSRGSEHEVNERQYPMELHIVTFKVAYDNFTNAQSHGDGLAVLGFFFEISNASHPVFDKLVSALPRLQNGSDITFDVFSLRGLIPNDTSKYYRYLGSLTTPGCLEIVVWTVFQETIKVSEAQIEAFRQLTVVESTNETIHLEDNFRPVQPLYGRQVMVSFDLRDTTTLQPSATTLQPSATTLQPSTTTLQPSATTLQPSATTLQPSATTLQPSATTITTGATVAQKTLNTGQSITPRAAVPVSLPSTSTPAVSSTTAPSQTSR